MTNCRITYDRHGTPGIWAADVSEAYWGIGWVHGKHRPVQSLLIGAAARGCLGETVLARDELVGIDSLMHRLGVPDTGKAEADKLSVDGALWLDAYLAGWKAGFSQGGQPAEFRLLMARLPPLDRSAVISGLMLSGFLGLAEGQERMERAIVASLAEGADPALLEMMFSPFLKGWDSARLAGFPARESLGFGGNRLVASGGSNAWAVGQDRSHSGSAILCGDPHLQINQLPALFSEVRVRLPDGYWLGATIPGLPGIAVGRNRHVAWSGTFGVADNVDFAIEEIEGGRVSRGDEHEDIVTREVEISRRFKPDLKVRFYETSRGVLELEELKDGPALAVKWSSGARPAEALDAYMQLPMAKSSLEAEGILEKAHTLSLHFVLADRAGDIRYCQAGFIPKRTEGWSGLYPVDAQSGPRWDGFYQGALLPRLPGQDGIVVSANERRPAADGGVLSTLAQPTYRMDRIRALLEARHDHGFDTMRAIQLDVFSRQGEALLPRLVPHVANQRLREALENWDCSYDAANLGAHAFELCYEAALRALAPELGGEWYLQAFENTEMAVWWMEALDKVLLDPTSWEGERGRRLHDAIATVGDETLRPWGQVQELEMRHMVLGGLPRILGFDKGPYPLPGSRGTPRQAVHVPVGEGLVSTVAPAFRMVCDLGDDGIWTTLPGGIDGSRFSRSYTVWLQEYLAGSYHRLAPPTHEERVASLRS